ncbi:MAG: sensor histidine kinase [Deltaproteobacteria bacterium]|nr:sensor histidine kinase [Deltaproteobacteria bacterium]
MALRESQRTIGAATHGTQPHSNLHLQKPGGNAHLCLILTPGYFQTGYSWSLSHRRQYIDATIQSVRRISSELRPGILDDLGLIAAIEWQAKDFQDRSGIKCEFKSNFEEIDLDRNLSTAVFRIFQETLTNVIRHAKATRVRTTLVKKNKQLELKVEDNGKGIAKNKISDSKSLGLAGMRERVLLWGGQIDINGIRGQGTTVQVFIPVK